MFLDGYSVVVILVMEDVSAMCNINHTELLVPWLPLINAGGMALLSLLCLDNSVCYPDHSKLGGEGVGWGLAFLFGI